MKRSCPRIVVAGVHSGVGKTTVSLALVAALTARGFRAQAFKVGPDYLDPTYLSIAAGRPCFNLDGWMTDRDYVRELFVKVTEDAEIAVVEGVMGLFDGADADTLAGSTAEAAGWLEAPVILVVNAHGLARSIAPLVKGFAEFDPRVRVAGVIANHSGSKRHGEGLADALEASGLPRLLGAFPRGAFPTLPDRHLGLVTADREIVSSDMLRALAEAFERHASIEKILDTARAAGDLDITIPETPRVASTDRVRIGLAFDEAFHFYYPDNLLALEAHGCEIVRFSPLRDHALPRDLDGMYLGGGYPEEYAGTLAANRAMIDAIRRFAETGKPLYAECGGLMYLSRGIETLDGRRHELVGLLPAWTRMLDRLKSLGYVETTVVEDSLFGLEGAQLRGHEFHYSELLNDPTEDPLWRSVYATRRRRSDEVIPEGFQSGRILVSYVHMHFASRPEAVRRFTDLCGRIAGKS